MDGRYENAFSCLIKKFFDIGCNQQFEKSFFIEIRLQANNFFFNFEQRRKLYFLIYGDNS